MSIVWYFCQIVSFGVPTEVEGVEGKIRIWVQTFILANCHTLFFFFKLYIIVLVLPNIKMNPPQVYKLSHS